MDTNLKGDSAGGSQGSKCILRNSPNPNTGHSRDSKSADAIGAQLYKLPYNAKQSQFSSDSAGHGLAV
jgi:hypothetical protein